MKQIIFNIECGEKTCAASPGRFCEFTGTVPMSMGQDFKCLLFGTKLFDVDGWIQRCPQCLDQAKDMHI